MSITLTTTSTVDGTQSTKGLKINGYTGDITTITNTRTTIITTNGIAGSYFVGAARLTSAVTTSPFSSNVTKSPS
jgi:hypothetical protein